MTADNKKMSNATITSVIPVTTGNKTTNRSGIIAFHDISVMQNLALSPFLKNRELMLPFPKPHVFPQ